MKKILIVDDKINVCETIKYLFKDKGHEVIYALTGKDGLDMFEVEKPDVVILDMRLGDMSGLEVLERIKDIDPSCRVIVLTGSYSENNRRQSFKLGADHYLSKPFSIDTLNNVVLES
ncbi:response regulator [bacterium]|nr:response regulator [bacterium]